jgi:hypothetical protein
MVGLFFGVKTLVQHGLMKNSLTPSASNKSKKTKKTIDALVKQAEGLFQSIGESINTINKDPFLPQNRETITTENMKITQLRREVANTIAKIDPLFEAAVKELPSDDVWVITTRESVENLKSGRAAHM